MTAIEIVNLCWGIAVDLYKAFIDFVSLLDTNVLEYLDNFLNEGISILWTYMNAKAPFVSQIYDSLSNLATWLPDMPWTFNLADYYSLTLYELIIGGFATFVIAVILLRLFFAFMEWLISVVLALIDIVAELLPL